MGVSAGTAIGGWLQQQQQAAAATETLRGLLATNMNLGEVAAAQKLLEDIAKALKASTNGFVAANKVFNIGDLLAIIFERLEPGQLLAIAGLNKATNDAINTEPVLRRKAFQMPDPSAGFSMPFVAGVGPDFLAPPKPEQPLVVWMWNDGYYDLDGFWQDGLWYRTFDIEGDLAFEKKQYGSKSLSLLICQPPVYKVEVRVSCCGSSSGPITGPVKNGQPIAVLNSARGITVRQLHGVYKALKKAHKNCTRNGIPDVQHHNLETGEVKTQVIFSSTTTIPEEDSMAYELAKRNNAHNSKMHEAVMKEAKLTGFVEAKKQALQNGLPIPTLAEFHAEEARIAAEQAKAWASSVLFPRHLFLESMDPQFRRKYALTHGRMDSRSDISTASEGQSEKMSKLSLQDEAEIEDPGYDIDDE